jgi:hypothetical protein
MGARLPPDVVTSGGSRSGSLSRFACEGICGRVRTSKTAEWGVRLNVVGGGPCGAGDGVPSAPVSGPASAGSASTASPTAARPRKPTRVDLMVMRAVAYLFDLAGS